MVYKLNVTEHADELLDKLVYHLIYRLKNDQAAKHLLDCIDVIYDRLEVNPFQFAECRDAYLSKKGYREAVVPQMNYIIIFDVRGDVVNVVGIFHQLDIIQINCSILRGTCSATGTRCVSRKFRFDNIRGNDGKVYSMENESCNM